MRLSKLEKTQLEVSKLLSVAPPPTTKSVTLYDIVRDYPHRTVSTNTAYIRMLRKRHPLKLHEACTQPVMYQGRANATVSCSQNPYFWLALHGRYSSRKLASYWGIHFTTVNKYRRDLKEGLLPPLHLEPISCTPFTVTTWVTT
ncbi:hypothetical protein HVE01_30540 [Vreelandella venusta]|nr:hypothetical protein HVE01_30540 [Halomonas venusta]